MASSPLRPPMPEWQLWAYNIKSELQQNIIAFDDLLKDFQVKMASIDNGLNLKFDLMNGDLQAKGSVVSNIMLDVARLHEVVNESRTSLADQGQRIGALGADLAAEEATSTKRYKEQIVINRNIREDMQRAADHLTDLQMQARKDSDRKENDIAILKAENEAFWPQLEELRAMLMQLTSEQEQQTSQPDHQTQAITGRPTQDLISSDDRPDASVSPPRPPETFSPSRDQLGGNGLTVDENGNDASHVSNPEDPQTFSSDLQLTTRGHRSYKEYIKKGTQEVRAALAEEMKQLEEMYGKKFVWNLGNSQWRSQLWQELEETGWNWENVEARAMQMLEEKQKPRKRSRQYLEY